MATTQQQGTQNKPWFLAVLLAWAVPGLGHWYLGRRNKATVFSVFILGLFVVGLALGDWKIVNGSDLLFIGQVLTGFVSFFAAHIGYVLRAPAESGLLGSLLHVKYGPDPHLLVTVRYEMSQLYTLVAGLLNLLTILDAYLVANNIRRTAVEKGV